MLDRLMKLMVCFTFLAVVGLFTMGPYSGGCYTPSLVYTSSTETELTVVDGAVNVTGVMVMTDGSNNATLQLLSGSGGTVQYKITVLAGDYYGGRNWAFPLHFDSDGLYADLDSDGTATFWVEYIKQ